MAYVLKTYRSDSLGANGGTGGTLDTTGADLIIVSQSNAHGTAGTLSDSKSNTWHALTTQGNSGSCDETLYYANAFDGTFSAGSGHTFTITGSSTFTAIAVACFSGSLTSASPLHLQVGNASAGGTTIQAGSINTAAGELVISNLCFTASTAVSIDSSFNITNQSDLVGGTSYGVALAYKFQANASENPTWSGATGGFTGSTNATFKPGAAATGGQEWQQPISQPTNHYRPDIVSV